MGEATEVRNEFITAYEKSSSTKEMQKSVTSRSDLANFLVVEEEEAIAGCSSSLAETFGDVVLWLSGSLMSSTVLMIFSFQQATILRILPVVSSCFFPSRIGPTDSM